MNHLLQQNPQGQRGIATILVVLLVGFTLMVATMNLFSLVRSTQDQALTSHASIQSQPKVWNSVELVRQFLFTLNANDTLIDEVYNASNTAVPITATGVSGITTSVVGCQNASGSGNCTNSSDDYYVTVNVTAATDTNTKAASTSTVEVIYHITQENTSSTIATDDVIVFNDDVILDSNIELVNNTGQSYNINISGDLYAKSNIVGFEIINSEGNVTLESNPAQIERINANGDVKIDANLNKDDGLSTAIYARGNICLYSNAYTNDIAQANGFVYSNTSNDGQFTDVTAIGSSDWSGAQLCGSNSDTIDINQDSDSITLPNGETYNISGSPTVIRDDSITPVSVVNVEVGLFNALEHENNANYVIKRVGTNTKVTVTSINDISDGTYFLRNRKLCTSNNNSTCVSGYKLCGTSDCFDYSNGTFTIKDAKTKKGKMVKQGVIWVEGNLKLEGEGLYYNTFMATGNIIADGNHTVYAVNYAGYAGNGLTYDTSETGLSGNVRGICPNSGGGSRAPVSNKFYPTNYCDNPNPLDYNDEFGNGIGNFTLTAGSVDPDSSAYIGGDITISGNISQYGSLIAGNKVIADSNINIHGTITAESHRTPGTHTLTSNITIHTVPVATYTPGNTIETNTLTADVKVMWSRYL